MIFCPILKRTFNILEGRENTAMAGLSMGAEQTMNIGIGECLDVFSYFGVFSSVPFSESLAPWSEYKNLLFMKRKLITNLIKN